MAHDPETDGKKGGVQLEKKENPYHPQCVFEAVRNFESQIKRLNLKKKLNLAFKSKMESLRSAQSVVEIARVKLEKENGKCQFSALTNDIDLAVCFLEAAERVSIKKYEHAEKLLGLCLISASRANNPLQRVIISLAKALRERIDIERKRIDSGWKFFEREDSMMKFQTAILVCQQKLPFMQLTEFTGMQAVLDSVELAEKVHFIDFGIKSGSNCIILMQDLANRKERKFDMIKITAVGTSRLRLEETGERLSSFAKSLDLPFSFRVVVSEMQDLKEELFELDADEKVAVYSGLCLWSMLSQPNQLENFMNFVKKLKPRVMVVIEMEANLNTDIFMDRFQEAVTLSCAMFDCVDECLQGDQIMYKKIVEDFYFKQIIKDIIVSNKKERVQRHAKIDFWRKYFEGFGIVEKTLSRYSRDQADLLLKSYACWSSCTVDMDGDCMIVKWNGTPIQSLSVWKLLDE